MMVKGFKNGFVRSVSFSGIDGAGKSTQIRALRALLERRGLKVRTISFWDEVATLTRLRERAGHRIFHGDLGVGTPEAPVNRKDKNVQTGPMTCLRLLLYLLDAISLRRAMARATLSDSDVLIFDRYLYDELANLNLRNPLLRVFVRCAMWMAPRPDLGILLDAEPEQARARKPEYPVEFLIGNRRRYIELRDLIGQIELIRPMPAAEVHAEIGSRMIAVLETDHRQEPGRTTASEISMSGATDNLERSRARATAP